MKRTLRFLLLAAVAFAMGVGVVRATEEQEETLGDKLKKLFVRPTLTPKPRKKKRVSPAPSAAASTTTESSPIETPAAAGPSPETSATVSEGAPETTPSATAETKAGSPTPKPGTQYFEAVRPISPHAPIRRKQTPRPRSTEAVTILPAIPASSETPEEIPAARPMPSLPPIAAPAVSPTKTPAQFSPAAKSETPPPPRSFGEQIADYPNYSPEVRKIVDLSLDLTTKNLSYKYVSADPKNGGMDSSGFIFYVLTQSGVKDVPRDAREQYIWVRKAGNFKAVLAQRDDTFELDELKPGDLLFWATNFGLSRDPDISQTMIYLGREKETNQRVMVGASENRSAKERKKSGVGVFEFKVGRTKPSSSEESAPVFVGYGRVPGSGGK